MTILVEAGMEAKDWVSSSIAVLALGATIWLGIWANRKNAAAQRRQHALAEAQHDTNTRLVEMTAELAKRADPAGSEKLPTVQWVAEHSRKNRWLVRNIGAGVATNVTVDKAALSGVRVNVVTLRWTNVLRPTAASTMIVSPLIVATSVR